VTAADEVRPVRRALIAVADKRGVVELARGLSDLGVAIVSSGGTADAIRRAGIEVTGVAEVTGWPEMLGGRVKTLHPRIHGGILADRTNPDHMAELEEHGIEPFDLVVVNLYPLREAVLSGVPTADVIEQIDIGGPAMVRAAAKNHGSVGVVVRPERYEGVSSEIRAVGGLAGATRRALAVDAFAHTAAYDSAVAAWMTRCLGDPEVALPSFVGLALEKVEDLRYGENPHQQGALYRLDGSAGPLGGAAVLQGKAMSFNNWLDASAARGLVWDLSGTAAVIVKHNNPCGAAVGETPEAAYRRAHAGDPVSAFGGVVAFNAEVDDAAALAVTDIFTEVVVAPSFSDGARAAFAGKENLRLVAAPREEAARRLDVRVLEGGAVVQTGDPVAQERGEMVVPTERRPTEEEWRDLLLAWTVAAHVKSNAIVLALGGATVGVGAGQMSRVDSVDIAARKAGDRARGAAMASDAFFPFRDGIDRAAEAGVSAVIQPGGSVRDAEVLLAAEEHGMAMVITARRHFRH
jgi:phosphoribosylaminoimidazolecarboxamide formyltransferase/IMP cyclohydrolase